MNDIYQVLIENSTLRRELAWAKAKQIDWGLVGFCIGVLFMYGLRTLGG